MKTYDKYMWAGGILFLVAVFAAEYSLLVSAIIFAIGWYCFQVKGLNERKKAGK